MAWLNETTIEGHSPAFDVGARRNFEQVRAAPQGPPSPGPAPEGNWPRCVRQVFGSDPRLWFLPVWGGGPAGDGVHWERRPEAGELRTLEEGRPAASDNAVLLDHACSDSSADAY